VSKAENILKTKGRKKDFSPTKAENILKTSQFQEAVGTLQKHDKMTFCADSPTPVTGGGKGLE
jgi:hypothetical protein